MILSWSEPRGTRSYAYLIANTGTNTRLPINAWTKKSNFALWTGAYGDERRKFNSEAEARAWVEAMYMMENT